MGHVKDTRKQHKDWHHHEADAWRHGIQVWNVSKDARESRLCTQEKEDCSFLRRGLLARVQVRPKEKACKKVLARQDWEQHEARQEVYPEAQTGRVVCPKAVGAWHWEESGEVHEKDTCKVSFKIAHQFTQLNQWRGNAKNGISY